MNMALINKKAVKEEFRKRNAKIGNAGLELFAKIEEDKIKQKIEEVIRNMRISGRKALKKEDLNI